MGLILLLWFIPLIQNLHPFISLKNLDGWVTYSPNDTLTCTKWFNGTYTPKKDAYIKEQFGFRNFFVRARNQIYFSLLKVPTAKGIVIGKDNILYEERYIKSYMGADFIGQDAIKMNINKLKFVSDTLKKLNIDLVLLLAPGKATYYPEYIPNSYFANCDTINTNYKWTAKIAKEEGLNFIDYNSLFKSLKNSTKFPLYPKTGIHWSYYGAIFAFDSLTRYIESIKQKHLKPFTYNKVEWNYEMREQDEDIGAGLNTLFSINHYKMPYPFIEYTDTNNKYQPKVTTISDSYWSNIYNSYLPKNVFKNPEYWYFYSQNLDYGPGAIDPLTYNLKEKIESNDVIIIMATECTVMDMGWGFIEDAYNLYSKGEHGLRNRELDLKVLRFKRWMYTEPKILFETEKKAKEQHIRLDEMMDIEAYRMMGLVREEKKTEANTPKHTIKECIKKYIRSNTGWMKNITTRAQTEKSPINEIVFWDAETIFGYKSLLSIKASNDKFLCADENAKELIISNRDMASTWETFTLLQLKNNTYAIYSYKDKFLSTDLNNRAEIVANKNNIGACEIFTISKLDNDFVAFKATNGKYVSLDEKSFTLLASSDKIGKNERFKLVAN